ncbi:MAG: dTDP-4-dehydrorhamnose 3,5-epimerase, partial [Candidatus Uhrbacteria bacterium]|nr:dTDP-4-dehydrorhamnose 3,5-epimerase [Candidatus Uhrbacteria bacterium]
GFYALEDSEMQYKSSNTFDRALDANLAWNDPEINIAWPLVGEPIVSDRDKVAPTLAELELPF